MIIEIITSLFYENFPISSLLWMWEDNVCILMIAFLFIFVLLVWCGLCSIFMHLDHYSRPTHREQKRDKHCSIEFLVSLKEKTLRPGTKNLNSFKTSILTSDPIGAWSYFRKLWPTNQPNDQPTDQPATNRTTDRRTDHWEFTLPLRSEIWKIDRARA